MEKSTGSSAAGKRTSSVSRIIKASRKTVYQAFLDPQKVAIWLAPDAMKAEVQELDARVGGAFKMTLTYLDPKMAGKSTGNQDSVHTKFAELIPDEKIVELSRFESDDPKFAGEMKMIVTLADVEDGTNVKLLFENIPPGISIDDNNEGSRQSLAKLAKLVEG